MTREPRRNELRIENEGLDTMIRALVAAVALAASFFAAPTASADPVADLMGMLPHGFGP